MGKKLLGGAVGVLTVANEAVRHAVWYLRYRVDGTSREEAPQVSARRPQASDREPSPDPPS